MTTPNILGLTTIKPITQAPVPLPTSEGALYTVGANKAAKVETAVVANTTNSAVTASLSTVRSGGFGGATNRFITNYSLAAYDSLPLGDYLGRGFFSEGDFISGIASAAGVVFTVLGSEFS